MAELGFLCLVVSVWAGVSWASKQFSTEDLAQRMIVIESRQRESDVEVLRLRHVVDVQSRIIESQTDDIAALRLESAAQKQLVGELQGQARRHDDDISQIQALLPTERRVQELVKLYTRRNESSAPCDSHRTVRQVAAPTAAAFTVYHDAGMLPQPGEVIAFNKAITNEGGAYDMDTGVFTCPRGGVYLFSFTVGEVGVNYIWADLMVKGVETVEAAAETFHDGQDLMGANTAVLRLATGDLVWVAAAKLTGQHLPGGGRLTSFTGAFLHD